MKIGVGVDLHKHQMTYYIKYCDGKRKDDCGKLSTTKEGYCRFINLLRELGETGAIKIAVESTGNTKYFKKKMEEAGFEVHIVNTMKFKIIEEMNKKNDKNDARSLAEYLIKDMIPEVYLCSEESEILKSLIKHRSTLKQTIIKLKNQIHEIMLGFGIETKNGQLNSKTGRMKMLKILENELKSEQKINKIYYIVKDIITSIEEIEERIKDIEDELKDLTVDDEVVSILRTIPGTGLITSITIRAYIDDINKFSSYEKLSSYAGLVPWVQSSDVKYYYGKITKHGPVELRTAFIQMVIGMIRVKKERENRYMYAYRIMKKEKGSGKSIVATARKLTKLVWVLLKNGTFYDPIRARNLSKNDSQIFVA